MAGRPADPEVAGAAPSLNAARIEEIADIVVAALEASRGDRHQSRQATRGLFETLRDNWGIVAALVSLLLAFAGWLVYDVSPLSTVEEIAHRQEQRRFQRDLVARHLALGNDFLSVGQLEAAKLEFTRARELDQYSIEAEVGLLKVSVFEPITSNDYSPEVAERRLQAILQGNANDTHALAFLGEVFRGINQEKALEYYEQALDVDSGNALAYFGKAVLADEAGKRAEALPLYEKAVTLSPWNQTFLNNLAYQHFLGANYEKADELYVLLLSLDSRYLLSYYMLGHSRLLRGQDEQAYRTFGLLDQLLADDQTISLRRNTGPWFFHVDEGAPVYLYTNAEKRAYAHYVIALAASLSAHSDEARQHLAGVAVLGDAARAGRRIVVGDMRRLQKARPEVASRLALQ